MDWYAAIFELIDTRSFSNMWYWIGLAVLWSSASHWVLGVPYDMVHRARKGDPAAVGDLEDMARVNIRRMLMISRVSGLWILGGTSFAVTATAILAFFYWVEFAQAVFLLLFPMVFVGAISLVTAQSIEARELAGEQLVRALIRHRIYIQLTGVASIFVTAMFGMAQNLSLGAL